MSNPFLDPEPSAEGDDSASFQTQNGSPSIVLSKSNPFYEDVFGAPADVQPSASGLHAGTATLVDLTTHSHETREDGDGLDSSDILLDVGGGADGHAPSQPAHSGQTANTSLEQQDFSIPPPMEFSDGSLVDVPDCEEQDGGVSGGAASLVTNIDDLLGMSGCEGEVAPILVAPVSASSGAAQDQGSGSDESFDFLLDEEEARKVEPLAGIEEEEAPPPVPTATFPGEMPGETPATADATRVFLPSENPADNVTRVAVAPEAFRDDGDAMETPVYKTDITVTSPKAANVTSVSVTASKPTAPSLDQKPVPGPAVVRVDNGCPPPPTQIEFDTSASEPVASITVPADAFVITTQGVASEGPAQEEEVIRPMMVVKDHQGNKLATPSPPETLGRQSVAPKILDEAAKRDLQSVLTDMNRNMRSPPVMQNGDKQDSVQEDEIVPVKFTRKEAETAEMVLKNWVSDVDKTPASPAKKEKKFGFQKAVGTVLDVQAGKKELPENSVYFTTIGVTSTRQKGGAGEEEEITPMTVHKDHLGHKHCAPSPPESRGRQTQLRTVDQGVKQDMATLMSAMSTRSSSSRVSHSSGQHVDEESIVPTQLSRDDACTVMSVLTKWTSGESAPQPAPSAFQRLVGNVLDTKSERESESPVHVSVVNVSDGLVETPSALDETDQCEGVGSATQREEEEIVRAAVVTVNATPPDQMNDALPEPKKEKDQSASGQKEVSSLDQAETKQAEVLTEKKTSSSPPGVKHQSADSAEKQSPAEPGQKSVSTSGPIRPFSASQSDSRPTPSQRSLRAPVKLGSGATSLSQPSSVGSKPLARLGGLSVGSRGPSLLSSSRAKPEYGKTRTDHAPFLVEVLKGIVGLGIKVAVTPAGHVQVTEVQRNSPVDKNGNIRVGDYLICVNTTELTGLPDGRVQQVLRLLPRGLVKLVVSTQAPADSQDRGGETDPPVSPRPAAAYSQYGVRLSPRPFSPASPTDGQSPPLTSPTTPPVVQPIPTSDSSSPLTPSSSSSSIEPLTVSVEREEDQDMSTRKLTKALSPRSRAAQSQSQDPPSPEPPKPAPRQRATVPTSLSAGSEDSHSPSASPRKAERKMTAQEVVAAASRRPSGRGEDLPAPTDTSPAAGEQQGSLGDRTPASPAASSPRSTSSVDAVLEAARHPSGVSSPRDEALPVFVEAAKKVSPTPTPRARPRTSSSDDVKGASDVGSPAPSTSGQETEAVEDEVPADIISPESVLQTQTQPTSPKVPPPVAPKPKRTPSVGSDRSASSSHSEDGPKDVPSPTVVSPKLRNFSDASAPTAEDQQQSKQRVTSAARMFEKKAEESARAVGAHIQPKTNKSVSSVIKSFNKEPEPPPPRQPVVTRKISLGVHVGSDGHAKPMNSALLPPSERRKSMPNPGGSSSFSLTKPSSLAQLRNPPSRRNTDTKRAEEDEAEKSSRMNSALRPRPLSGISNTTSLKGIAALRDSKEEKRMSAPPAVGKDRFSKSDTSSKSPTSPSSVHDVTSPHGKHAWASSFDQSGDDPHSPKMIFTSSSLHHTPRPATRAWKGDDGHDPHLESTMKKFDDLLSDKHTFDSDDELPKVSNSVSLDLLKSRNANRVSASLKSKEEEAAPGSAALAQEPKQSQKEEAEKAAEVIPQETPVQTKGPETEELDVSQKEADSTKPEVEETVERIAQEMMESVVPEDEQTSEVQTELEPQSEVSEEEATPETSVKEPVPEADIQGPEMPKEDDRVQPSLGDEVGASVGLATEGKEARTAESEYTEQNEDGKEAEVFSLAAEMAYQQQASSIVDTVMSRALMEVAIESSARTDKESKERASSPPPPPLPDEEPPPLPGAPPPPLILRNEQDRLVDAADLDAMLPSQEDREAGQEQDKVESSDVELELDDNIAPESIQQSFSSPLEASPNADETSRNREDVHVLISLDDEPSVSKSPVLTELPVSGDSVEDGEKDVDNRPVSDTLSQDSGVQDEDMSEDGLRFSHDDSPTSNVDSSVFDGAMTPDDETLATSPQLQQSALPVSDIKETVLEHTDGVVSVDGSSKESVPFTDSHSVPVMSDVTESTFTLSQSTPHPHDSLTFAASDGAVSSTPHIVTHHAHREPVSALQDSSSPKCSSAPLEEVAAPGGVSTTGSAAWNSVEERDAGVNVSQERDEQTVTKNSVEDVNTEKRIGSVQNIEGTETENDTSKTSDQNSRDSVSSDVDTMAAIPEDTPLQDSADVASARKWCILDQSGSLFLHGDSKAAVTVTAPSLRRVASASPGELAAMIAAGNQDVDVVKGSQNVELRVVAARGLDGRPLQVDVFQREDYLVQVTQVLTNHSPLQEGDLLLSVDGRGLKNKRPKQVHAQLAGTGPKGVVLTARGVKLPASAVRHDAESIKASSAPSQAAPPPPSSSPSGDTPEVRPALPLGGGMYEVTMQKGATGVGFCLEGGKASPRGDLPILIKRIFKGGPAEKCGQLQVKDEILAVNDVDFTSMRHYEAWNHLKFLDDGEIRLKIRRASEEN